MKEDFTNERSYSIEEIIGYMILGMKKMEFSYLNTQKAIAGLRVALKENSALEAKKIYLEEYMEDILPPKKKKTADFEFETQTIDNKRVSVLRKIFNITGEAIFIPKYDPNGYPVVKIEGHFPSGENQRDSVLECNNIFFTYNVILPDSITCIGERAFSGCHGLTHITIPNSVTSIGNLAFRGCKRLTSITIPDSVTSIGRGAFYDCKQLTNITLPNSITGIEFATFRNCSLKLTSITLPNSITSIGDCAFGGCLVLESIIIPNNVTSIVNGAFFNCTNLKNITFEGTIAEWNAISLGDRWNSKVPAIEVKCSDGNVPLFQ